MPIMLRDKQSNYVPPPEGTHLAIAFRVVDVGIQPDSGFGEKCKVVLSWELPEVPIQTDQGPKPMSVSKTYTQSLNGKATLRQDLVRWRGREFTPEQLKGFDLASVLGKPCQISIVHETTKEGKVKGRIEGVFAVPKGLPIPKPVNPLVSYSLEQGKDEVYRVLPDWIKGMVDAGLQKAAEQSSAEPTTPEEHLPEPPEEDSSDVPF